MANSPDTFEKFQRTLDPYIKPREQVNYIRRVLALQLGSSSGGGPIKQPASLADGSHDVALDIGRTGIQKDFLEALKANVTARRQYAEVARANTSQPQRDQDQPSSSLDLIEERATLLKLQAKRERLLAVQKHFDLLVQQPAASQEFLDPDNVFQDTTSLPSVPKEVVNSLVEQQSAVQPNLKEQLTQLEKTVLRTKLLLRREEQLLHEARANAQNLPDVISNGTRLEALNATRNELIAWIETELGKASGDEDDACGGLQGNEAVDRATINGQLNTIKEKYARYLDARRSVLANLAENSQALPPPVLKPYDKKDKVEESEPAPSSYLLTPYIEHLLSVSRSQKAMITQKSHINSILNKQKQSDYQVLNSIAEESQLLPAYPTKASARRRSVLGDVLPAPAEPSGFTGRVQPWVFAADSAKIATLEMVAEKVEGGQVALESSMQALQKLDRILGQGQEEVEEEAEKLKEDQTEDDFWLDPGSKRPASARKHTEKKDSVKKPKDAFSGIHGNLGLLGQEDLA